MKMPVWLARRCARWLRHPRPDFVPRLLDLLKHPDLAQDAAEVLARMGTPAAAKALNDAVLEGDTALRFRVIAALNKLHQTHPELERDRPLIETVLSAEILGHYRSYQLLGTMGGRVDEADPAVKGLQESISQEVERIFRLLALLHPDVDLHSAYYGVQSANQVVHDHALEFLDNVLASDLRRLVVPLVDSTVSVTERSRLANQVLGLGGASKVSDFCRKREPLELRQNDAFGTPGTAWNFGTALLAPQERQRVGLGRAPRRQVGGEPHHRRDERHYRGVGDRIGELHLEEQGLQPSSGKRRHHDTAGDAQGRTRTRRSKHAAHDVAAGRSDRHANRELAPPIGDIEAHQAEQTQHRQSKRHRREQREHPGAEAPRRDLLVHDRLAAS